jgi:hypothetical protein
MSSFTRGRTSQGSGGSDPLSEQAAIDVIPYLIPDLRATLASLAGAPRAVAQATAQLLPLGSRMALEALGLAVWNEGPDQYGVNGLTLTDLAFNVAEELAAEAEDDSAGFTDWTERARQAMQELQP